MAEHSTARADELIAKTESRDALFGVIGLGYVGLPLALELVKALVLIR